MCFSLWCWINSAMYLTGLLYFVRRVFDCKGGHLYMAITQLMALVLFLLRCPCDPIISAHIYSPLVFLFVCWEYFFNGSHFYMNHQLLRSSCYRNKNSVGFALSEANGWAKQYLFSSRCLGQWKKSCNTCTYPIQWSLANKNFDQRSQAVRLPMSANFYTSKDINLKFRAYIIVSPPLVRRMRNATEDRKSHGKS